ncbi:hypothetical protein [Neptuniibacter halophilus]|uniref:hypothetical protein n=1 Tax=Neptuniibacter halophilus TaxID=651666 RepID=UPI002572F185|nr:hypothetical protein [Neptuniibacter halophilus]
MGIVGRDIGSSIKRTCPACDLPVHVVVETFKEDVNFCPHCGGSLVIEEWPEDTQVYIYRLEQAIQSWRTREHGPGNLYMLKVKQAAERLADKIVRTDYDDPSEGAAPAPVLEHVIVRVAKQRLAELEAAVTAHSDTPDLLSQFSELTGLTELARLKESGLSELALKQLNDIDAKALEIMGSLAK